ncbi:MAG: hypothetical protein NBV77_01560 [Bacteroidia bacterium]|nr:hypothetical protein [Bacteroidia bacterium]
MEVKLSRFASLLAVLFCFISLLHILDEVLPPLIKNMEVANTDLALDLQEEIKINKQLDFSLILTDPQTGQVIQVEVDEATYYRVTPGQMAYVYLTPIYLNARFALESNNTTFQYISPFKFRPPFQIRHILLPILIFGLSILVYKTQKFEVKLALFLFTTIISIILQWLYK